MNILKTPITICFLIVAIFLGITRISVAQDQVQFLHSIPTEGNSWVIDDIDKNKSIIKKGGIKNWSENVNHVYGGKK